MIEPLDDDFFEDWIECWNCGGEGRIGGCFEDTCCCLGDPDDPDTCCAPRRCDVCRGKGRWKRPPDAAAAVTPDQQQPLSRERDTP